MPITMQFKKANLEKQLRKVANLYKTDGFITVGFHGSKGHKGSDLTQAKIARINHFGSRERKIPARPFLDVGIRANASSINQKAIQLLKNGTPSRKVLLAMGALCVASVQKYMTELMTPPNAPSTQKRKGGNNPLIDTGELRSSVTYEYKEGS